MPGAYLSIYERLPEFLKRRLNPLEYALRKRIRVAAGQRRGQLVLDAGAGEKRFQSFFKNHRYLALDLTVGDSDWDYSGIDVCADLEALPLRPDRLDMIINTQVLEHVRTGHHVDIPRGVKPEL